MYKNYNVSKSRKYAQEKVRCRLNRKTKRIYTRLALRLKNQENDTCAVCSQALGLAAEVLK